MEKAVIVVLVGIIVYMLVPARVRDKAIDDASAATEVQAKQVARKVLEK